MDNGMKAQNAVDSVWQIDNAAAEQIAVRNRFPDRAARPPDFAGEGSVAISVLTALRPARPISLGVHFP
jgi:hypothetical protein